MIRRLPSLAAVLTAASLLLTACGGGTDDKPTAHPVFAEPVGRQPFLALRQTQKAGSATFTQTVTFVSKKGNAVQTSTGRVDFADSRGEGSLAWTVPDGFDEDAKDVILGTTPGRIRADPAGRIAVDTQTIHYRAESAAYWIRYGAADADPLNGVDSIRHLRGSEAAIGGTLLEAIGAAEAASQQESPSGGRTYRASFALNTAWDLFPSDLTEELAAAWNQNIKQPAVPLTLTVDAKGRITRAEAELSGLLKGKDSVLADVTAIRAQLTLTGHGTSKPVMPTASDRVLDAATAVTRTDEAKAGECVDFNAGLRNSRIVVRVPCATAHDGRIFAQSTPDDGGYPGAEAAADRADEFCRRSHDRAPADWTDESVDPGRYWTTWSTEHEWAELGKARATCYVVSQAQGTTAA
ncbi:hypothetical protein ACIHCQ_43345 [Streptomyces sp. NPDC052236]|uniref:hypothetical protein n=1 Tax=Streptomyces sp. NPDC052236 TaxID=3365686 RepID=UPI0037CEA5A7